MEEIIKGPDEIREELEKFLEDQKRYNETGDRNILWNDIYPYLKDLALSALKKKLKGSKIKDAYEEVADDIAVSLIGRYIKDRAYSKNLPLTMVYYRTIDELYNKHRAFSKRDAFRYDLTEYDVWNDNMVWEDDIIEKLSKEGY